MGITFIPGFGIAQESKLSPILEKGIGHYKHENYEEALPLLQQAREDDPQSTIAAYYLGLNLKQQQKFKKAVPHLRDAVTKTPKIKGALIELIDALYNVGELEEAKKWIGEAENEGIRPAQVAFLKGLVRLKENKVEESISSFEKAKGLDKMMEQACDYQIAIAHLKAKDFAYAKQAFEDVITLNPSSNMALYANEYIDVLKRRVEGLDVWKVSFGTFWQYDDNVVLKPDAESIAGNIADSSDSRYVYTLSAEFNKRLNKGLGFKGQYNFYNAKQNDLGYYDTTSHSIVLQPSLYFEKSLLAFPVVYTHSIVNDSSYLSYPSISGIYNRMIGNRHMAQGYVKYGNKDFRFSSSTPDENRDSSEFETGAGWYTFFARRKGFVNLRYVFEREWTEGNNWEYAGNHAQATLLVPLLEKLNLTLTTDANFQRFLNTHTVYNVKRRDNIYTTSALLAYKFYKDSEVQLQYTHVDAGSNIDVYNYDRNIYSVGVQMKF